MCDLWRLPLARLLHSLALSLAVPTFSLQYRPVRTIVRCCSLWLMSECAHSSFLSCSRLSLCVASLGCPLSKRSTRTAAEQFLLNSRPLDLAFVPHPPLSRWVGTTSLPASRFRKHWSQCGPRWRCSPMGSKPLDGIAINLTHLNPCGSVGEVAEQIDGVERGKISSLVVVQPPES